MLGWRMSVAAMLRRLPPLTRAIPTPKASVTNRKDIDP
jgi:hypothetical protein